MSKFVSGAIAMAMFASSPAIAARLTPGPSRTVSQTSGLAVTARCPYKHINISQEKLKLKLAGFWLIKYTGTSVMQKRCAQFVRFRACKGAQRKKVTVRYIKGQNRFVIVQPSNGSCPKYKKSSG